MESMRDIRNRITSVQKTMKITNAMYLMASSKLKRAKKTLSETDPYFHSLQRAICKIIRHTDLSGERFFATEEKDPEHRRRHIYIVITSDRGLAGSFNHNACQVVEDHIPKHSDSRICCIGTFGLHYFQRQRNMDAKIEEDFCYTAEKPSMWLARELADHVIQEFRDGHVDVVHVVFTQMVNALQTETRMIQMLPLHGNMFPDITFTDDEEYIETFDPSPAEVLRKMIPNYVKGLLYGAMVESYAAEQNARMSAMDSATKNAKEIVASLSLEYNRIRQAAITTEITEVVSGASAQQENRR